MNVFNLTPYNLGPETDQPIIRRFRITADVSVIGVVGAGRNVRAISRYDAAVVGESRLFIRKLLSVTVSADISALVNMRKNVFYKQAPDLNIAGRSVMGKNIHPSAPYGINARGRFLLGKNIHARGDGNAAIQGFFKLGKKIRSPLNAAVTVNALLQISAYLYDTVTINITVPPGSELLINSDTRTVLMDGENVFYALDELSEWIFLHRETLILQIESNTGGMLAGELQYDPRYL